MVLSRYGDLAPPALHPNTNFDGRKANAMRIYAKVPANLWLEFYLTAIYLHNKTATLLSTKPITPYKKWHNRTPDYSYMREIGSRCFVLIQSKHNPKIYERSVECVLIGYDLKSKTYRCYNIRKELRF